MGVSDGIAEVAKSVADLYKEIVTTSVRFDELRQTTDKTLTRLERLVEQVVAKVEAVHDTHVRERALLEAQIRAMEERLANLSEQALHVVTGELLRRAADHSGVEKLIDAATNRNRER